MFIFNSPKFINLVYKLTYGIGIQEYVQINASSEQNLDENKAFGYVNKSRLIRKLHYVPLLHCVTSQSYFLGYNQLSIKQSLQHFNIVVKNSPDVISKSLPTVRLTTTEQD